MIFLYYVILPDYKRIARRVSLTFSGVTSFVLKFNMLFFLTSWYKISFGEFRSKSDRLYLGLMCSLLTTALSNQRIFGFLLVRFSSLWDVHNYGAICFFFRALCYFIRFMTKRKQTRQRERLCGKDRAICVILYGRGLVRRTFSQLKQSFSPR